MALLHMISGLIYQELRGQVTVKWSGLLGPLQMYLMLITTILDMAEVMIIMMMALMTITITIFIPPLHRVDREGSTREHKNEISGLCRYRVQI